MSVAPKIKLDLDSLQARVDEISDNVQLVEPKSPFNQAAAPNAVHIVDSWEPEEVLEYVVDGTGRNVVQKDSISFETEVLASSLLISHPQEFLKYPLSSILAPEAAGAILENKFTVIGEHFRLAKDKNRLITHVEFELNQSGFQQSLVSDVVLVADELITNAVYDAPYVDEANTRSGVDRNSLDVQMAEGHHGYFFMGRDNVQLVIGCTDPYGSLNIQSLMQRILRCYNTGVEQNINMGKGGAQIGAYIVFQRAASLYYMVNATQQTIVCCSFPIGVNTRKRMEMDKNLHIYEVGRKS